MVFKPQSISIKLWLATTLLILTVLGGLGVTITWMFSDFYLQQKLDALKNEAVDITTQLSAVNNWNQRIAMLQTLKLTSDIQLVLLDSNGEALAVTGVITPYGTSGLWGATYNSSIGPFGVMGKWVHGFNATDFFTQDNLARVLQGNTLRMKAVLSNGTGTALLIAATPLGSSKPYQGVVLLGTSPVPVQESINTFRRLILYTSLIAVVLAALVSLIFARQVTRPLAIMQKAARRMAEGDFEPIEGVKGQDEIGELAQTLNQMGESLSNHMTWLFQEKNLLQGIVEGISDPVIMLSSESRLLYANEPAKALWENDAGNNERQEEIIKSIRGFTETNKSEKEFTMTVDTQILQVALEPMREAENVEGYVAVLHDITASLHAEKERRDFLASVTHELRTPLHLIQGYLEAIQDGVIPEDEKPEHIDMVLEEAKRLARLVQNLQDINRLERLKTLKYETINVDEFFQDLNHLFKGRAQGLGINLEFQDETKLEIMADRDRLLQVFINLLDNAIRHTPPNCSVRVNVKKDEANKKLKFSVEDEGEGIPPNALQRIFESFYRVDKARSRKDGGMGLGLAIVKQIIEAHQGTINVDSTISQGTTFWFELPVR